MGTLDTVYITNFIIFSFCDPAPPSPRKI